MTSNNTPNGNGNGTGFWRQVAAPQMILALAILLFGGVMAWARIDGHTHDCNIHHTTAQLDAAYTRRDVYDERQEAVEARLERIETKIDRLTERVGGG